MYDQIIRNEALQLRKKGYSVWEISQELGIAKSTSSLWVSHVKMTDTGIERLNKRVVGSRKKGNLIKKIKWIRKEEESLSWAKELIKITKLLDKDQLKIYCSLLYWAEGAKDKGTRIEFTNSDPKMIRVFLYFLRNGFDIDETGLRVNMHLHDYHNENVQKDFWSKVTKIPARQFYRTYKKPSTHRNKRENYPGCVRISYKSSNIGRQIKAIYKAISMNI